MSQLQGAKDGLPLNEALATLPLVEVLVGCVDCALVLLDDVVPWSLQEHFVVFPLLLFASLEAETVPPWFMRRCCELGPAQLGSFVRVRRAAEIRGAPQERAHVRTDASFVLSRHVCLIVLRHSVEAAAKSTKSSRLTLKACLDGFTETEQLDKANLWYSAADVAGEACLVALSLVLQA